MPFETIHTDLHSHLLPGLDDGASTLEESLQMINGLVQLGFKKLIITPHVSDHWYPNTKERILGQLYALREALEEQRSRGAEERRSRTRESETGPKAGSTKSIEIQTKENRNQKSEIRNQKLDPGSQVTLEASAEYHLDENFLQLIQDDEVIPIGKARYLLFEFPFDKASPLAQEGIELMIQKGYKPILAHPERYPYLLMNWREHHKLKEMGVLYQMTINAVVGRYVWPVRKTARRLIKSNMIDFVGSDAHFPEQVKLLERAGKDPYFQRLVASGKLRNSSL